MSDKRIGTVLKKCQKCQVDMNGDMLDAQGLCPRCKVQAGEEQQKSQQGNKSLQNETVETQRGRDFKEVDSALVRSQIEISGMYCTESESKETPLQESDKMQVFKPGTKENSAHQNYPAKDSVEYDANETMDNEPDFSDFITCHRSGRRNAIHDLQGDSTNLNLQKLSGTMEEISIAEGENQEEAGATDKEPGMTPKSQDGSPPL